MSRNVVEGQGCRLTIRRRNVPVPSLIVCTKVPTDEGAKRLYRKKCVDAGDRRMRRAKGCIHHYVSGKKI
jgi:hypothetical protein